MFCIILRMFKIYKNIYLYLRVMEREGKIKLTPDEEQIFMMLKQYRNDLELKTVLRVAGGWVRDKVIDPLLQIMGKESHDIDIALDNMKGQEFVVLLKQQAEKKHEKISGFGVTKFNPDLSKHLETATAQINNHWIDFVNLRSQKYSQHSRIPIIEIGTPEQDAERRDFTINSMFYNLDTQMIEDWTGKGISDLENGILRTPLKPYQTFKDDPLRILRCLRFKSRFLFAVEPDIYEAMKQSDIKQALLQKVSKQRIAIELAGILKAKHCLTGLNDIRIYGLWNIIFQIPKNSNFEFPQRLQGIPNNSYYLTESLLISLEKNKWITADNLIEASQQAQQQQDKKQKKKKYPKDELQVMMMLSSLTCVYYPYEVKAGKTKSNLTEYMIKDQLKYPAKYAKFVLHLYQGIQRLSKIHPNNLYAIIRWLKFVEQKWQLVLHLQWSLQQVEKIKLNINVWELRQMILKQELDKAYLVEPPIDGTFIKGKGIKGPMIGRILENASIWKITNPTRKVEDFIAQFESNPQFFMSEQTYT